MKWTISVSSSLDEVLAFLTNERGFYALEDLKSVQYRFLKSTDWQAEVHTLGGFRQNESLKALFFPAREFIGRWDEPPVTTSMSGVTILMQFAACWISMSFFVKKGTCLTRPCYVLSVCSNPPSSSGTTSINWKEQQTGRCRLNMFNRYARRL